MAREAEQVAAYMDTVKRLEPDIHPIDVPGAAASIAISLKRSADEAEETNRLLRIIADALRDLAGNKQPGMGWGSRG